MVCQTGQIRDNLSQQARHFGARARALVSQGEPESHDAPGGGVWRVAGMFHAADPGGWNIVNDGETGVSPRLAPAECARVFPRRRNPLQWNRLRW